MKLYLSLIILLTSTLAQANTKLFCKNRLSSGGVQNILKDTNNTLNFMNHGGIINGGVCWWHSRFNRNAAFLAYFQPTQGKPTYQEALQIITEIRKGKSIVTIPGYKNLSDFSLDYGEEIQRTLENWQKVDGFVRQKWIGGLKGSHIISAEKLSGMMDELYQKVAVQKEVIYQKLQLEGLDAHAWLVLGMDKLRNGYRLHVLDSNEITRTDTYIYKKGMTHLEYHLVGDLPFVPYSENMKELERLKSIVAGSCNAR